MMSTKNTQKNSEDNNKFNEKDVDRIFKGQSQELNCQKQIKILYERLSKAFEKGISLENKKRELQENKLHLSTTSNPKQQNLYKQLIKSRQQYKISQLKYASIKNDLISNSSKIKETTKQIQIFKKIITEQEQLYQKMKQQTQKLKQRQIDTTKTLIELQQNIKQETIKKLALMKIPKYQNTNLPMRQQILRKIKEMKKINQVLKEMLIS